MYIAMNRFKIVRGSEEAFEKSLGGTRHASGDRAGL